MSKVWMDISNTPINAVETYPWDEIANYADAIFSSQAALGRVGGPDLSERLNWLRERGTRVWLYALFGEIRETDKDTDWHVGKQMLDREDWIAYTASGQKAVRWPGATPGYHIDPARVGTLNYALWLQSLKGEAHGLLLDFVDRLGKPWTPEGYDPPEFASTPNGLVAFNTYREDTIYALTSRLDTPVILNGRGAETEAVWFRRAGASGTSWEAFGAMHAQGPEACEHLTNWLGLGTENFLCPDRYQPQWAQAAYACLGKANVSLVVTP